MTSTEGLQILNVVDGGSANKGQDVHLKLKVSDGTKEFDLGLFIAHDLLPLVLMTLGKFGGMARNTRLGRNPHEEADGQFAGAHAFSLSDAFAGNSITRPGTSVLSLQADVGSGRKLNFYLASDRAALTKLQNVCAIALKELDKNSPVSSRDKLN